MDHNHRDENTCVLSNLDLFSPAEIQVAISRTYYDELLPYGGIPRNRSPIRFQQQKAPQLIDLQNSYFVMDVSIQNADGSNMPATGAVECGLINYPAYSLIKKMELQLNGTEVTHSTGNDNYEVMMQNIVSFDSCTRKTQMTAGLDYPDTAGHMGQANPAATTNINQGLTKRAGFTKGSQITQLMAPLRTSLAGQDRPIIFNTQLDFSFYFVTDAFGIMSAKDNANFRFVIHDMRLHLRKIELTSTFYNRMQHSHQTKAAIYPIVRSAVKTHHLNAGKKVYMLEDAFITNQVPKRFLLGIVNGDDYTGSYKGNPFNFRHHNLSSVSMSISGLPTQILKLDFANASQGVNGYHTLYQVYGQFGADVGNSIDREEYRNGNTLLGFDLSPTVRCEGTVEVRRQAAVALQLEFADDLTQAITVLILGEWNNNIEIAPKTGAVTTDFTK